MIEYENSKEKVIREEDLIYYDSSEVDAENLSTALSIIKELLQSLFPKGDTCQILLSHFKSVLSQNPSLATGIAMGQKQISPTLFDGINLNFPVLIADEYRNDEKSIIDLLVTILSVFLKAETVKSFDGLERDLKMKRDESIGINKNKNKNKNKKGY